MTSGGSGSDTTAIHDNVASEISAISEKASPVSADLLIIEDSAASNAKKKVQVGNLPGLHNVVEDTTPQLGGDLDADGHSLNNVLSLATSEVKARDANGLKLYDDDGNGIFIKDGGKVGIGETSPDANLHVYGTDGIRVAGSNIIDLVPGTAGSADVLDIKAVRTNKAAQVAFSPNGTATHSSFTFYNASSATNKGALQIGVSDSANTGREHIAFMNRRAFGTPANPITTLYLGGILQTGASFDTIAVPSGNVGIGLTSPTISDGTGLHLAGKILRIGTAKTPSSASDTGNTGEICWDSDYVYVCTATNTWKRAAIASW